MGEINIFTRLFRKLKCLLGLHDWVVEPDGVVRCWDCGKEMK
jgi:hypothetical protein